MANNPAASEQTTPTHNLEVHIVDCVVSDVIGKYGPTEVSHQVCNDLLDRAEVGFKRYGMYLQPHNGRDSLLDAYQELLDGMKYMRNRMQEQYDPELAIQYHNLMDVAMFVCKRLAKDKINV